MLHASRLVLVNDNKWLSLYFGNYFLLGKHWLINYELNSLYASLTPEFGEKCGAVGCEMEDEETFKCVSQEAVA